MASNTKGIVLMAFGKAGYYYAAFNMAMSIKYFNPKIKITLLHDGSHLDKLMHLGFFDKMVKIKNADLYDKGALCPAKAKIAVYNYLPYQHNLYLDVDGIALQDVEPLLDYCVEKDKPYLTEVRGTGKKKDVINYAIWTENGKAWDFFNLKEDSNFPAIQSSFAYIQKGSESKKIFDTAKRFYNKGFDKKDLKMQWGGTIPDELIFSGTCAKLDYNPSAGLYPIFFGWQFVDMTFTEIAEKHYILSLYGNGKGKTLTKLRYKEYYDRLIRKYSMNMGVSQPYKSLYIMRDKHAG